MVKNHWIGRKHTDESKLKMRLARLGKKGPWAGKERPKAELSCNWKGDKVGYGALHDWVRSRLGRPDTCEECGEIGLKGSQIHWANISGKYKRDLTDWQRLCVSCHFKKDQIIQRSWITRKQCVFSTQQKGI